MGSPERGGGGAAGEAGVGRLSLAAWQKEVR